MVLIFIVPVVVSVSFDNSVLVKVIAEEHDQTCRIKKKSFMVIAQRNKIAILTVQTHIFA